MLKRIFFWLCMAALLGGSATAEGEHVILLHGLARTSASMQTMADALTTEGYVVANIDYPSRSASLERLSDEAVTRGLDKARRARATRIHFVTHSLGGILVRNYLARHSIPELGRVVMLAPPNGGSEVVNTIGGWRLFRMINGPAGNELGTDAATGPRRLGPATFPLGVIAGNRSINWINSAMIEGRDDGKVSVENTKLEGMTDHIVVSATHPFIMRDADAIRQTIVFLKEGNFARGP